jgi:hypothetical protein
MDIDCASGRAVKVVYNKCMELLLKQEMGPKLISIIGQEEPITI